MKVFNISLSWDCAGVGYNLHEALNKYTNIQSRQCVGAQSYIGYDYDIFCYGLEAIEDTIKQSDILHFNHLDWNMIYEFGNNSKGNFKEIVENKKLVYHNHGGHLPGREMQQMYYDYINGKLYNRYDEKAIVLVCSPFYMDVYNNSRFIPNILPINNERYVPSERDFKGTIRICHSPSVSSFKGTNSVDYVLAKLKHEGFDIHYERIVGTPHKTCMERKKSCHIGIDSMDDLFPNKSSFENMSVGLVNITNMADYGKQFLDGGSEIPIVSAKSTTLYDQLKNLLENRDELQAKCEESRKWMEKYYDDKELIKKWVSFYESI